MERDLSEIKPLSPQSDGHENYDNAVGLLHEEAKSPQSIGNYLTSKFSQFYTVVRQKLGHDFTPKTRTSAKI